MVLKVSKKILFPLVVTAVLLLVCFLGFLGAYITVNPLSEFGSYYGNSVERTTEGNVARYKVSGVVKATTSGRIDKKITLTMTNRVTYQNADYTLALPSIAYSDDKNGNCVDFEIEYLNLFNVVYVYKTSKYSDCIKGNFSYDLKAFKENSKPVFDYLNENDKGELPASLDCKQDGQCSNIVYDAGPYSWIRYGQMSDKLVANQDIFLELDDLGKYEGSKFNWRLNQYGEMVITDVQKYSKYIDQYLEILPKVYNGAYMEIKEDIPVTIYTRLNPPTAPIKIQEGLNPYSTVMRQSAAVADFAWAYKMTNDPKYKRAMDSNFNFMYLVHYSDTPSNPAVDSQIDFKESSCYAVLGSATAYETTGDTKYLRGVEEMISLGSIEQVYSTSYSLNSDQTNNSMNIIACIDGLERVARNIPNGWSEERIDEVISKLYQYIFFNQIVDNGLNSKLYGVFYGGYRISTVNTYSPFNINSTMWFQKVINDTLTRRSK